MSVIIDRSSTRHFPPVDVVYILGNGSKWSNREIFYSVRSVEKHLKHYRKIFVVGTKPVFFGPNVIEIPYDDMFGNKARNIMAKVHRAASDHRVTNNFLLLNDDYFLLKDVDARFYPYIYKCQLEESIKINAQMGNGEYLDHLTATLKLLRLMDLPTKNFDTHFPILYNKKKFREVCARYNWSVTAGYILKSVYCNSLHIEGEQRIDCKISHPHIYWDELTNNLEVLSIGDRSATKALARFLHSHFPNAGPAEQGGVKIW